MPDMNPRQYYRINKQNALLTRGIFNVSNTGAFIAYEKRIDKTKVEILISGCKKCNTGPYYITIAELELAEGCIECEYCSFLAFPLMIGD